MADGMGASRLRLRPVSLGVLLLLLMASIGGFFALRHVVNDQEHRLLVERTVEAQSLVDGSIGAIPASLGGLIAVAATASPAAFVSVATPQVRTSSSSSGYVYLELLRDSASGPVVVAAAGQAPDAVGAHVSDPAPRAAVTAALRTGKLNATPIYTKAGERRLGLAMAGAGYAVYAATPINAFGSDSGANQPFHELYGALYADQTPRADQLIFSTTRHLPLTGDVATAVSGPAVKGVALRWLLVAKARTPLAGSTAHAVPWVVLGFGLVLALVGTVMVETLLRRRRYALELVEERTADLRASLEELEHTQQELISKERLAGIGQLASAVGHELRNPLGVLTNVLFLLRSKLARQSGGVPDDVARQLDTADREVTSASLIVSDLLEFARARQPVREPVDLVALVDESLSVAPPPAHVHVVRRHADGLPALSADRDQLRQVILNLLTNAYQSIADSGTVTLAVEGVDGAAVVSVTDDGAGMTAETKARLFEPFFTTKAKGVGLGLAVSQRIAESHGGVLECESAPGEGTSFRLVLPVVAEPRASGIDEQAMAARTGGEGS